MHRASWAGQDEVVDYLLDHGANIEARDDDGFTPLLSALSSMAPGAPSQSTGTHYHSPTATISHLLDRGANGDRALCLAVGKNLVAAVGVLAANRTSFPNCDAADVLPLQMVGLTKERSCKACVTLLFAAAGSSYEMVRLLLATGDRQVTSRELDAMVTLGATKSADLIRQTISPGTTASRPIK